jgi:predicted nucleic acid-binding protein
LLDLAIYNIPTTVLAVDLASSANITAYDACYAVLAQNLNAILVTADVEMIKKLALSKIKTRYLMDL